MSPITAWGPATWTLFHTLAEKINENDFQRLSPMLFLLIKRICSLLPCPECSEHATQFLAKIQPEDISTKADFQNLFYLFHNSVNARKKKPLFNHVNMGIYKSIPLQIAFNNFVRVYNTRGNMRLLAESFQRNFVVTDLKKFLLMNIKSFLN